MEKIIAATLYLSAGLRNTPEAQRWSEIWVDWDGSKRTCGHINTLALILDLYDWPDVLGTEVSNTQRALWFWWTKMDQKVSSALYLNASWKI